LQLDVVDHCGDAELLGQRGNGHEHGSSIPWRYCLDTFTRLLDRTATTSISFQSGHGIFGLSGTLRLFPCEHGHQRGLSSVSCPRSLSYGLPSLGVDHSKPAAYYPYLLFRSAPDVAGRGDISVQAIDQSECGTPRGAEPSIARHALSSSLGHIQISYPVASYTPVPQRCASSIVYYKLYRNVDCRFEAECEYIHVLFRSLLVSARFIPRANRRNMPVRLNTETPFHFAHR
jgi:hypothetical protein